ncbi:MAG: hypothetical protein ACRED5_16500 [Propylenella sp.]
MKQHFFALGLEGATERDLAQTNVCFKHTFSNGYRLMEAREAGKRQSIGWSIAP